MTKDQLAAFTDAVIAIILTLMVLDIHLPPFTQAGIIDLLRHVFAYAISFGTIAIGWLNLRLLLAHVRQLTANLVWSNLLLLFFMSLLPLPTQALGERFFEPASHVFFGLIQALVSLAFWLIIQQLKQQKASTIAGPVGLQGPLDRFTMLLYGLSMVVCYVSVYLSTLLFLVPLVVYYWLSRQRQAQSINETTKLD